MRLPGFHTNGIAVSIPQILKKLHRERKNYTVVEWRFPRPCTFAHKKRSLRRSSNGDFFPRKGNAYEAWVYLKDIMSIKVGKVLDTKNDHPGRLLRSMGWSFSWKGR